MQQQSAASPLQRAQDWAQQHTPATLMVYALAIYVVGLALQSFILGVDYRLMTGQLLHSGTPEDPIYEMGAGLGFWAIIFFCLNFILATRWRWVETLFGGLDRVYQLHGLAGKLAFTFLLAHMGILVLQALPNLALVNTYLLPGLDLGYTLGVIGVASATLLVAATLWVRMPYGVWLNSHKWMIAPYLLGTGHAFVLQQDWYMLALSLVGGYAWFYSTFLYRRFAPSSSGHIETYHQRGSIHDLRIRFDQPFPAQPGQFVYLSVQGAQGIHNEMHPFSLSGQSADGIRLSVKALGDYTRSLSQLQAGDRVTVYGPYGRFGARSAASDRPKVWLAGGIGITPFLSLLQDAAERRTDLDGVFIWSVRERTEAVFLTEIEAYCRSLPGLHFILHVSSESGFLTGDVLAEQIGNERLLKSDVFLCGPGPMMDSLTRQLRLRGLRRTQIISEAFQLKP